MKQGELMAARDYSKDIQREIEAIKSSLSYGREFEAFGTAIRLKLFLDFVPAPRKYQKFAKIIDGYYRSTLPSFDESDVVRDCDQLGRIFYDGAERLNDEYIVILITMLDLAMVEIYTELNPDTLEKIARTRQEFQDYIDTPWHHQQMQQSAASLKKTIFTYRVIDSLIGFVSAPRFYAEQSGVRLQ